MSRRTQVWLLVFGTSVVAQPLTRALATGAWIVTWETATQVVVVSLAQIAVLELVRWLGWRRAW